MQHPNPNQFKLGTWHGDPDNKALAIEMLEGVKKEKYTQGGFGDPKTGSYCLLSAMLQTYPERDGLFCLHPFNEEIEKTFGLPEGFSKSCMNAYDVKKPVANKDYALQLVKAIPVGADTQSDKFKALIRAWQRPQNLDWESFIPLLEALPLLPTMPTPVEIQQLATT